MKNILYKLLCFVLLSLLNVSVYAQLTPSGSEIVANNTTANNQQNPSVAMAADNGNYVVVWESYGQDGDGYGIYFQEFDNMGTAIGSETLVNTTTANDQRFPSVAISDNGKNFIVVWQSYNQDGDNWGIYSQRYATNQFGNKTAVGGEVSVNTTTVGRQSSPKVANSYNGGTSVITWESDGDIYATKYNNSGQPLISNFLVNTTTSNKQSNPNVTMDSDGDFVVVWQSHSQDGDGMGIYGQRYDLNGVAQGSETLINTTTTGQQLSPGVAMDANGNYVVAWTDSGADSDKEGIYCQRFNASGTAQGSETLVNTTTSGSQDNADVAMNQNGDYIIAWNSYGQDGQFMGVYHQSYLSGGTTVGGEVLTNTTTNLFQQFPKVAMKDNVNATIVWQDGDRSGAGSKDGNSYGVVTQLYDVTAIQVCNYTTAIYVDITATGNNDGTSWTDAFTDLQDAIDAYCGSPEIWVATGVYKPTKDENNNATPSNPRTKTFYITKDMPIYGGFIGTETARSQRDATTNITVLSGDLDNSNTKTTSDAYNIVSIDGTTSDGNISNAMILDGFEIRHGYANGSGTYDYDDGSAILIDGRGTGNEASPIINDCEIHDCHSGDYGVVLVTVSNTTGIANPTLSNIKAYDNYATYGGYLFNDGADVELINNLCYSNSATYGGAIYSQRSGSNLDITNSTFYGNAASSNPSSSGMYLSSTTGDFTNNIFWGSGAYINGSNHAYNFANNIYYSTLPSGATDNGGNIFGTSTLVGFTDAANNDFTLTASSAAIDAGDDAAISVLTDLVGNTRKVGVVDMGAYEYAGLPLPVELLTFTAEAQDNGTNLLEWETASEENNYGFDIERSFDGTSWEYIGFVTGNGTTTTFSNYEFVDENPIQGKNYYRLKQIDFDGAFEYSEIRLVELQANTTNKPFSVYPNPVRYTLTLENTDEIESVIIHNVLGQPMRTINITTSTNQLNVEDLTAGQYYLQANYKNGNRQVIPFLKK